MKQFRDLFTDSLNHDLFYAALRQRLIASFGAESWLIDLTAVPKIASAATLKLAAGEFTRASRGFAFVRLEENYQRILSDELKVNALTDRFISLFQNGSFCADQEGLLKAGPAAPLALKRLTCDLKVSLKDARELSYDFVLLMCRISLWQLSCRLLSNHDPIAMALCNENGNRFIKELKSAFLNCALKLQMRLAGAYRILSQGFGDKRSVRFG